MKLVIFGLTVSSSWGNGHATLWRGLCAALARAGTGWSFSSAMCRTTPNHRDIFELPGGELVLYPRVGRVHRPLHDAIWRTRMSRW